jgi:hypothetical protein
MQLEDDYLTELYLKDKIIARKDDEMMRKNEEMTKMKEEITKKDELIAKLLTKENEIIY